MRIYHSHDYIMAYNRRGFSDIITPVISWVWMDYWSELDVIRWTLKRGKEIKSEGDSYAGFEGENFYVVERAMWLGTSGSFQELRTAPSWQPARTQEPQCYCQKEYNASQNLYEFERGSWALNELQLHSPPGFLSRDTLSREPRELRQSRSSETEIISGYCYKLLNLW